ncbi:phage portal protein [Arthrobacter sp. NA-172]|uniref:phage portal protein n=1 Tax=Arthrobacter sp. NA-172 TaxID=3367524 RepID=UPI003754A402
MILSGGRPLGFAPQALGETTPFLSNGYFYPNQGLGLANSFASYSALYRAQPSIMTLVDKISASAARIPMKSWQPTPGGGKLVDVDSPFARLLANPCTAMSRFNFYRWTFSTYEIYGEAFWYKQRRDQSLDADGKPVQSGPVVNLLPMHPSRTMVHRDGNGNLEYVFTLGIASAGILRAPEEDVVAFLRYNPDNLMRGLSRLEGLRSTLFSEDAARRANASFWQRGARPGTLLKHPAKVSTAVAERLKAQFDAVAAGPDRAGSTVVLEEGMEAQVIQLSAEEMQYIESRKLNMQEACMVYDFPPPAVHILDRATFSNITEQMRSVYRDTMTPRFSDFESVIGRDLRSEFFADGEREGRFDLTEVLRGDFETRADKAVTLRNSGIFTGNEARELVGLEKSTDPLMEKVFANAALVELGTARPPVAGAATVPDDPATGLPHLDPSAAKPSQGPDQGQRSFRSIMGRLSRAKGNRPALKSKLIEMHEQEIGKFFDSQRTAIDKSLGKKADGVEQLDGDAWNAELSKVLSSLSAATARTIGAQVASDLGGDYDPDELSDWISADADASAAAINGTTAAEVTKALDGADGDPSGAIESLFIGLIAARIAQMAISRVTSVSLEAGHAAARQNGGKTKTWVVAGQNPRPSHEAMSGESAPLNGVFSNGMRGPGDVSGGADEVAGCTCELEFSKEK